jgi:hypothetical protein
MTTPNSKFRAGSKEEPTEPFKRAVTSCLRAIATMPKLEVMFAGERPSFALAKVWSFFLLSFACTFVASVTLAANPSFKGEDASAHASGLTDFIQGHLGEVISLDVTYEPLPAGNDMQYDGPFTLQIFGPNTLYPAARADFLGQFQVRVTFNEIDRESTMRLRYKGTGHFELIRRDTRIPFAEYQFIPAIGSEPERALFVKNRANSLR